MTPEQIVARYLATYGNLRITTARRVAALWRRFGGVSDADAARFVAAAVATVQGAEAATVRLVAGYVATLARVTTGTGQEAAIDLRAVTGEALRGVPPSEVYRRPVIEARTALSQGKLYVEAFRLAQLRASTLAETDVVLAQRAGNLAAIGADDRIVGYRRVLTGSSCPLCAIASTQRYHKGELMPIHGHCDCGVAPIFGDVDPGRVINSDLLQRLKSGDPDAVKAEVAVRTHGEYGPTLVEAGDHFTGPSGIAA